MKILICAALDKEKSIRVLPCAVDELIKAGITPVMHEKVKRVFEDCRVIYEPDDGKVNGCDAILTVGGDGTILKWSGRAAGANVPLAGINTGRLGFMTSLETGETHKLAALRSGDYAISRRMMLDARFGDGSFGADDVLNDVVLFKNVNSKLPEYSVCLNGVNVTKVRADGLIFSTPTGSTAYALSAGGPVIEPTVKCVLMTPLCAHSLLNRPMIFSGNDTVTVRYKAYENSRVNISVDGGEGISFSQDQELIIKRSEKHLDLIDINHNSFYRAVSEKLMMPLK